MAGANAEAATEADVPTTAYDLARELVSRDAGAQPRNPPSLHAVCSALSAAMCTVRGAEVAGARGGAGCAFLEDEEDGILEGDEEDEYGEEDPSYHDGTLRALTEGGGGGGGVDWSQCVLAAFHSSRERFLCGTGVQ